MDKGNERIKSVDQFISKSDELAEWLYGNAYNCFLCNWPSNPLRTRLAVTYFYIALGHHKTIVLLTSHHCYGFCLCTSSHSGTSLRQRIMDVHLCLCYRV